jgi:hypothetical protein
MTLNDKEKITPELALRGFAFVETIDQPRAVRIMNWS